MMPHKFNASRRHKFEKKRQKVTNWQVYICALKAHAAPCDPRAPMDTFLGMLERDENTSPSSLEGLFEDLEKAHEDGLIELDAGSLSLKDKGRGMIRQASVALGALGDTSMGLTVNVVGYIRVGASR